jgi:hypothetical protein
MNVGSCVNPVSIFIHIKKGGQSQWGILYARKCREARFILSLSLSLTYLILFWRMITVMEEEGNSKRNHLDFFKTTVI